MKKLNIFYNGWGEYWKLAEIADNGKELVFEYTPEALKKNLELSPVHLPLKKSGYGNFPTYQMRLPGLIYDSLPDGFGLLLMDKLFRKQGVIKVSPLDRLAFLGDRTFGALSYEPAEIQLIDPQKHSLIEIAKKVQDFVLTENTDNLALLTKLGGSPHGARPKVTVQYKNQPWLIKFPSLKEHFEVCAIEALYAVLAKSSGLEISDTEYIKINSNYSAFGTKRFDRKNSTRIPIHTLSGVLHANYTLPSSVDYLTYLKVTRFITHDEREVQKAFRQCVFNVIFNNRDDHSKNFSFLLNQEKHWKLAPSYDLTFNLGPGGEHQMDICGEGAIPGKTQLLELAQKSGLNKKKCLTIIEQVLDAATHFKSKAKGFPIRKKTVILINKKIQENIKRS